LSQGRDYFRQSKTEDSSHLLIDMDVSRQSASHSQPDVPERQNVPGNEPSVKDEPSGRELVRVKHQDQNPSESEAKTAMSEFSR
jgi:hypothetical protein